MRPQGLCSLLDALVGHQVLLELRNEVMVRGTLTSVDARLNCMLSPAESARVVVDVMWVSGRNVKFVHLAANADPDALWRAHVKNVTLEKHRQRKQRGNRRTAGDLPEALVRKQAARKSGSAPKPNQKRK